MKSLLAYRCNYVSKFPIAASAIISNIVTILTEFLTCIYPPPCELIIEPKQ